MDYSSRSQSTTGQGLSFWLNALALAAVCGSLLEAFYWQIVFNELPCPLCQLQRVALTLAGIGMMLNVRFGPSASADQARAKVDSSAASCTDAAARFSGDE